MDQIGPTVSDAAFAALPRVEAIINYCGNIDGRGRVDFVDSSSSTSNFVADPHLMAIRDGRPLQDLFEVDRHGFAKVRHRSNHAFLHDPVEIERLYCPEMVEVIRAMTGARDLLVVRNSVVARASERAKLDDPRVAKAAHFAHMDYSAHTVEQFISLAEMWHGVKVKPYSRFAIYQTWRATTPGPHDETLTLTDARTVSVPRDLEYFDTVLPATGKSHRLEWFIESGWGRYHPGHDWYYFSDLDQDDLIIFKGFDSDPGKAGNVIHSGFFDPTVGKDAAPRANIEVRLIALFD